MDDCVFTRADFRDFDNSRGRSGHGAKDAFLLVQRGRG
jgi:hypothetical protein